MTTATPTSPTSPPSLRSQGSARRRAPRSFPPRRADAFLDTRPEARRRSTTPTSAAPVAAIAWSLGHLSAAIGGVVAAGHFGPLAEGLGPSICTAFAAANAFGVVTQGAFLQPKHHMAVSGVAAAAAAVSVAAVVGPVGGVVAGAAVAAFSFLPGLLTRRGVRAVVKAERARADLEILRILDDARRFRALGRGVVVDADADTRAIGGVIAQRDRLYRLLGLVGRGLDQVASVALYAVEGDHLVLLEQHISGSDDARDSAHDSAHDDVENHPRLSMVGRGVGPAGVVGLAVQRKAPLRVVDVDGAGVRAHRRCGPPPQSILCVPLVHKGSVTGVVVVDRVVAAGFTAADEAFVRAAAEEVKDGLGMEELIDALDAERRRVERVFAAARALAGATRRADVEAVALEALGEICAGVAIVNVDASDGDDGATYRVAAAAGVISDLAALGGASGVVAPTSFAARALLEGCVLPHVSLEQATPRPLLSTTEGVPRDRYGDARVVPLVVAGAASGVLVVCSRPGERLRPSVVDVVTAIADVVALALASASAFDVVEKRATTDGLTGVWNRRTLDEKLAEAVARARRSDAPLVVMMTDVDHFKSVNDTWGHATGDEVLKGVARCLQQCARGTDVVGRLGGEEFVVVCEGTDLDGAVVVAERMRLALKALVFQTEKGPLSVTSSFGVALLLPDDVDGHATLEAADKQLYRAKMGGRDRVAHERHSG